VVFIKRIVGELRDSDLNWWCKVERGREELWLKVSVSGVVFIRFGFTGA